MDRFYGVETLLAELKIRKETLRLFSCESFVPKEAFLVEQVDAIPPQMEGPIPTLVDSQGAVYDCNGQRLSKNVPETHPEPYMKLSEDVLDHMLREGLSQWGPSQSLFLQLQGLSDTLMGLVEGSYVDVTQTTLSSYQSQGTNGISCACLEDVADANRRVRGGAPLAVWKAGFAEHGGGLKRERDEPLEESQKGPLVPLGDSKRGSELHAGSSKDDLDGPIIGKVPPGIPGLFESIEKGPHDSLPALQTCTKAPPSLPRSKDPRLSPCHPLVLTSEDGNPPPSDLLTSESHENQPSDTLLTSDPGLHSST